MSQVICIADTRRQTPPSFTFFDKRELNLLLSLYSRRVADGVWRDYAIDLRPGMATFAVFRHTLDRPLFVVAKRSVGGRAEYAILSGLRKLRSAGTIDEVIEILGPRLHLVH
ncbi:MAG: DUF2794 domain-containing protein [Rhodospirillaceae bacterium]|nr:DUF2794 domain-containing protein [Rhodospirillaceae bacterium]